MSLENLNYRNKYEMYIHKLHTDFIDSQDPGDAIDVGFYDTGSLHLGPVGLPVYINEVLYTGQGQQGVTGPRGATGPKGDTGGVGATGLSGSAALKGDTGPTGAVGPIGIGVPGPQGDTGLRGHTGVTGAVGPIGIGVPGPQGDTGIMGNTGNTGPLGIGTTGIQGLQGNTGNTGIRGATGVQGIQGPTGAAITSAWSLTGNAGTNPSTNFLGATDNKSIVIGTNGAAGINRLQVSNNSRVEPENGTQNTFYGNQAGNILGTQNAFFGFASGVSNSGTHNTGLGFSVMNFTSSGSDNTGTGAAVLAAVTTGSNNSGFGSVSLLRLTTGSNNTGCGFQAGSFLTTGTSNTFIGASSGNNITTTNGNTMIDNTGVAGDTNTIRIGYQATRNFQFGIRGITPDANDAIPVFVSSTGQLCTNSSFYGTTTTVNTTVSGPWASTAITFTFYKFGNVVTMSWATLGGFVITLSSQTIGTPSGVIPVGLRFDGGAFTSPVISGVASTSLISGNCVFPTGGAIVFTNTNNSVFGNAGAYAGLNKGAVTYTV